MIGQARYREADRSQLRWDMVDLESQLPMDHRARVVWAYVSGLDLSEFYARIGAREGEPGRPPADPKVLLALWLYASLEGVGSARQLDRLCERDASYRWLCGGVAVNYHGLSDFRFVHEDLLDRLLSESLAALVSEGLAAVDELAIDGTKVKASAGKGSFRSAGTLTALEAVMGRRVAQLKVETESDPGAGERRRRAAQQRAAEDIARRAKEAHRTLNKLRAEKAARAKRHKKEEAKKGEPRASLSDPEARMMRFADGAMRPGYNIQLAVAPATGLIVAAESTDRRNDKGLAGLLLGQIERRLCRLPQRLLLDTSYASQKDIVTLAARQIEVYAPVPPDKPNVKPESLRKRIRRRQNEPEALKAWRGRMDSEAGKAVYRRRKRIETVNGILKGRGMGLMQVRSKTKVNCVVLLHVLAHNLWRAHGLRAAAP